MNLAGAKQPKSNRLKFSLVVAADEKNGIGVNGDLPWHLPGDMKFFRELTIGDGDNVVIMGRKTWQSIPDRFRPLSKRTNIVLSRGPLELPAEVLLASSLETALKIAESLPSPTANDVFIIGGGQVYSEALLHPDCQCIYLTRVKASFACHAFLPDLTLSWKIMNASEPQEENGLAYQFLTLEPK
jgi:dihydrofolate reductase